MINFKAKRAKDLPYSLHIPGNDGEEELIIIMTWGLDRKTHLAIVSATQDGAVKVLVTSGKRLILASVLATIDRAIEKWSMPGSSRPSVPEIQYLTKQRKKVLDKVAAYYEKHVLTRPD